MLMKKWTSMAMMAILLGSMVVATPGLVLAQEEDDELVANGTPAASSSAEIQMLLRPEGGVDSQRMEVEVAAGQSRQLVVYLGNIGADPLKVITFTADAQTRVNGGMQIAQEGAEQHEPTLWISYPTEELTIEPGTELRREFPVSVPDGTAPGEYVVPIAVETVDSVPVPGSEMFRQKVRKIMAIYIIVPGEMATSFEFAEPSTDYVRGRLVVRVLIANTGDTTIRLLGQMTLVNQNGEIVFQDPAVALGAIYRKAETALQVNLDASQFPPGEYSLSLQMEDTISGVSSGFEDMTLAVLEPTSPLIEPFEWGNVIISPNDDPIQFASLAVEVYNSQETRRGAKLVLVVEKDGAPLEDFVVADNMTLEQGATTITQRYLPLTGWESGTYTFSLRLEATDTSGAVIVLLTADDVATIEVP